MSGVTFGYMKWCGCICPRKTFSARDSLRGPTVMFGTRAPTPAAARTGYARLGAQVRYLRVPWTTRLEAVVAAILTL